MIARRMIALSALAATLLTAAPAATQEDDGLREEDWPCQQRYRPGLAAAAVWAGPDLGDAPERWREYREIARLAERLASPETSPRQGEREVDRFAAGLDGARTRPLTLLFSGLLEETGVYRGFAVGGVWEFTAKRQLIVSVLAGTQAKLLALPYDAGDETEADRKRLEEELFWQQRALDRADGEARYLCERIVYLEGKLGRLARAIMRNLDE